LSSNLNDLLPALLALNSACLFAISIQVMHVGLRHADPETGSLLHIGATTLFYWLLSPFFVESWYWLTVATLFFGAVGLFRPVLSANLALQGVRLLGPTLTSTLAATSPLFGVAFGVMLLGEELNRSIAFGTAAIMAGMIVMAQRGDGKSDWPLWAILLPLGAALFRSMGHVLTKFGFETVASAFFAAMVSYTVSFAVAATAHTVRRRRVTWRSRGLLWFVVAGISNGLSVLSLNTALKLGEIVTVVPIVSSSPFITLLLSVFVFRRETITRRAVITVCLVVPGVVMIALSR
jgi:DME family drug/metabolite transporter